MRCMSRAGFTENIATKTRQRGSSLDGSLKLIVRWLEQTSEGWITWSVTVLRMPGRMQMDLFRFRDWEGSLRGLRGRGVMLLPPKTAPRSCRRQPRAAATHVQSAATEINDPSAPRLEAIHHCGTSSTRLIQVQQA